MSIIPDNFADWRMTVSRLPLGVFGDGRRAYTSVTARRNGITLLITEAEDGWHLTKMHKGQRIAEKRVKNLPRNILNTIEKRRRQQRAGEVRYMAGRP